MKSPETQPVMEYRTTLCYINQNGRRTASVITYIASALELEDPGPGGFVLFGIVDPSDASCKSPVALYALSTTYK